MASPGEEVGPSEHCAVDGKGVRVLDQRVDKDIGAEVRDGERRGIEGLIATFDQLVDFVVAERDVRLSAPPVSEKGVNLRRAAPDGRLPSI